jgi:single-stranded-DNA-specific exonuclease
MNRRWLVNKTNPEYIQYLSKTSSISPLLAQILINRGFKTGSDISSFISPGISQLADPFDMPGMKTAVDRIMAAKRGGETVLVHGDYDADGITATAIMLSALKLLDINCRFFIPNRMEHGYGFKTTGVETAKHLDASLIITVDCGISSFEAAALCKKEGIDLVITDHHEPASTSRLLNPSASRFLLPDAVAVINPKIDNHQSSIADLSGAGIAFKFAQALALTVKADFPLHDLLDLAALGTMADVVPLTGENRLIVKDGMKIIDSGLRPGIKALKSVSGIMGKGLRTGMLLFTVIPRINAAGRIAEAAPVVKLFLTDSEDEAFSIASWLKGLNTERQEIEEKVYQEAVQQLDKKGIKPVIVLASEGWHRGVIGIVASRIMEAFYRPTFILSVEGKIARGSARSIPSFDICRALADCKEVLAGFGGHKQAAGLELETECISLFEECINRIAEKTLDEKDFISTLEIDALAELPDIGLDLIKEIEMLEPFGCGNPEPLIGSRGLDVLYPRVLKDAHLKMKLKQKNLSLDAIGFNMSALLEKMDISVKVDAVYTPSINEWEGQKNVQLYLKALRPSR